LEEHRHDPLDDPSFAPTLYTVGHGGRTAEEFVDLLRAAAIEGIADVRAYPSSRRHPHFSRTALASLLDEAGFAYAWLGKALGGFRRMGASSVHSALAEDSLRAYAEHMNSAVFKDGIAELLLQARLRSTAILCAERLPAHCHRNLISDYLIVNGVRVIHVLDDGHVVPHRLNRLVRCEMGQLINNRGGEQLGWEF